MFCLFSLLSYVIIPNQPPLILYRNGEGSEIEGKDSFADVTKKIPEDASITVIRINGSLRTNEEITNVISGTTNFYAFKNESMKSILSRKNAYLLTNMDESDAKTAVANAVTANNYTFVLEEYPVYDRLITNPFTAPVWNCLILIIFLILILSWAMYQYANIEVQTKFDKKIN